MTGLFDDNEKQVITGAIPSKSNSYIIVTFKAKARENIKDESKKPRAQLVKSKALRKYEESFYLQCNKYRNANITGLFTVEADVYFPSNRSDLDNCLKVLLDCLQRAKAYANDNMCTRIVANKFVDKVNPRIEFTVKSIN